MTAPSDDDRARELEAALRLTRDELLALPDNALARVVFLRLAAHPEATTPAARTISILAALDADVRQHGFDHYFAARSTSSIDEASDGLRAIGAREHAEIAAVAAAFYRAKYAAAPLTDRDPAFQRFDAAYARCDAALGPEKNPVRAALARYIRQHLDALLPPQE